MAKDATEQRTVRSLIEAFALRFHVTMVNVPLSFAAGLWRLAQGAAIPLLFKDGSVMLGGDPISPKPTDCVVSSLNSGMMLFGVLSIVSAVFCCRARDASTAVAASVLANIIFREGSKLFTVNALSFWFHWTILCLLAKNLPAL